MKRKHIDLNGNDDESQEPQQKRLKVSPSSSTENNGDDNNKQQNDLSYNCPYLDTINRRVLDFDFEKLCSVTLSNVNVYACLVCGKYFQGKGLNTPASTHSLDDDHHVFMNLHNCKIYCLPDGYEILDSTLNDIKHNLNPTYTQETIEQLDKNTRYVVIVHSS
jgi:U4/U6.U5 tri-snRNP-associated protein 2